MADEARAPIPARRGQALGYIVFGVAIGAVTAILSAQILVHVFAPGNPTATMDCPRALAGLWEALARARQSAAGQPDEQSGLQAFRSALEPEWTTGRSVEAHCGRETATQELTRALFRLRYQEEEAVRYGARNLAAARRELESLLQLPGRAAPASSGPTR